MTWAWIKVALAVVNIFWGGMGGLWFGDYISRRRFKAGLPFKRGAKRRCKVLGHFWMIETLHDITPPEDAPDNAPILEGFSARCLYCKRSIVGMSMPPGDTFRFAGTAVVSGSAEPREQPTIH